MAREDGDPEHSGILGAQFVLHSQLCVMVTSSHAFTLMFVLNEGSLAHNVGSGFAC